MYIYIVRTKTKNNSWTQRCIQYFNDIFHKSSYGGPGRELTRNGTITALPYQFNVRRSRFPPVLCQSRECMKLISYFVRFWRPPLFLRKEKSVEGAGQKELRPAWQLWLELVMNQFKFLVTSLFLFLIFFKNSLFGYCSYKI